MGFTLLDIKEMTLKQLNLYSIAAYKLEKTEHVNIMGLVRTAFHADQKTYSKITRDLGRD